MADLPPGYQTWSDYIDEAPEDLTNRILASHVDITHQTKNELASRLDRIADALEAIANTMKENNV